jgi:hypothetical protein
MVFMRGDISGHDEQTIGKKNPKNTRNQESRILTSTQIIMNPEKTSQ